MTPAEVRTAIYTDLKRRDERDPGMKAVVELVSPVPGQPLEIDLVVADPYVKGNEATRHYRIKIEEL